MRIIDQLVALADIWSRSNKRSKARLSTIVVNDGNFFKRIEVSGNCNLVTFEKFLNFFRDGKNWKDNVIPSDAAELLAMLENIATEAVAS